MPASPITPKTTPELFREYRVSVFRPKSETTYQLQYTQPGRRRQKRRTGKRRKADAITWSVDFLRRLDMRIRQGVTWPDFCTAYVAGRLANLSADHQQMWGTVRRWLEQYLEPRPVLLADVADAEKLRDWQARIRAERNLSQTSVDRYSSYVRAALRWAADHELLEKAPRIDIGQTRARTGSITADDLADLAPIVRELRPKDWPAIGRFLRGLFWSGLRLDQLRQLSWDRGARLWLDADGLDGLPLIWISAKGEKSRQPTARYVLPEFWEAATDTPTSRTGYVFAIPTAYGDQMAVGTLSRIISAIGKKAGIITDPDTGKHLSAHDLRKSTSRALFDRGYTPAEIQQFLGHADLRTTLRHYPPFEAGHLARREWLGQEKGPATKSASAPPREENSPDPRDKKETP